MFASDILIEVLHASPNSKMIRKALFDLTLNSGVYSDVPTLLF
jgi:hypothetical protein